MRSLPALPVILASLVLVACGSGDDEPGTASAPGAPTGKERRVEKQSAPQPPPASIGTTVKTASSQYGEILFDAEGQAIYLFDRESSSKPACYGACAAAWPPVLTEGDPRAAGGARAALLGTTRRSDGSTQVTYGGRPLYYYAHEGPGEVLCHNVEEFGGLWLVVEPGGEAVS